MVEILWVNLSNFDTVASTSHGADPRQQQINYEDEYG